MTLYRDIVKRAVKSSWSNKYFWFFGLFATFFTSSSLYGLFANVISGEVASNPFPILSRLSTLFSLDTFGNIGVMMADDPVNVAIIVLIYFSFIVLFFFVTWLSTISQGALVNNAALELTEKQNNFKIGLNAGIEKFWSVFSLNIFLKAVFYLGFFVISLPFILGIFQKESISDNLVFSIIFVFFVSLSIIFSFIIKYSIAYIVLKKENFLGGLKRGWKLFRENWLISIEMAFLLFFIDFFVNLVIILLLTIVIVPFIFMAILLAGWGSLFGFWLLMLLALILFVLIAALSRSIITAFQIVSWTDLFVVLTGQGGKSKLERLTESLKRKKN
ncbi:MAG: hypothetical protein PF572_00505 [Patescibacteria group bacterium]|jgi:hypothetical protein|nr:hypothetical protein [Patescibacteria group bacterium]